MNRFLAGRFAAYGEPLLSAKKPDYDDVINLSVGDTDITTDRRIIEAAAADAALGYTHYGLPKGDPELIKAVTGAWKEDYGEEIDDDCVLITASAEMGMMLALLATVNPGDEVIVFSPYYPDYRSQIGLAGGIVVDVPLLEDEEYEISGERLEAAVTDKTRAVIFNTPCNPTGMSYDAKASTVVAETAKRHDLLVIADEIYTAYDYSGVFTPMRLLPGMAERTVTINTFSKNFAMTGWRIGSVIATPEIVGAMSSLNAFFTYTAPIVSQRAALKAIRLRKEICPVYSSELRSRVEYAADRIEKIPYLTLVRPQGTFYLFPGTKRTGLSSSEFCRFLLDKAHITVADGAVFGKSGMGHIRIACNVGINVLEEAFNRMDKLSF